MRGTPAAATRPCSFFGRKTGFQDLAGGQQAVESMPVSKPSDFEHTQSHSSLDRAAGGGNRRSDPKIDLDSEIESSIQIVSNATRGWRGEMTQTLRQVTACVDRS